MLRLLIGGVVIAHGLVTMAIWIPNHRAMQPAPPMNTSHSWLLGDARSIALTLAIVAGMAIAVAGAAFLAQAQMVAAGGPPLRRVVAPPLRAVLYTVVASRHCDQQRAHCRGIAGRCTELIRAGKKRACERSLGFPSARARLKGRTGSTVSSRRVSEERPLKKVLVRGPEPGGESNP